MLQGFPLQEADWYPARDIRQKHPKGKEIIDAWTLQKNLQKAEVLLDSIEPALRPGKLAPSLMLCWLTYAIFIIAGMLPPCPAD